MVLPPVYERTRLICTGLQCYLLIYVRVILGLSLQGKKTCFGCSRAKCYEAYFDLKRRKKRWMEEIAY